MQADFFPQLLKQARKGFNQGFGGARTRTANPTSARPFARKAPVHVVLRSEKARGAQSLWNHDRGVLEIVNSEAARVGADVMGYANSGNHLHLLMRFRSPKAQQRFLRAAAGLIARLVLGAKKTARKLKQGEVFWAGRPFTRLVTWGRELTSLKRYLVINSQEQLYTGNSSERREQARSHLKILEELGFLRFG
jgi:REP element-mobilizing transposase RayT